MSSEDGVCDTTVTHEHSDRVGAALKRAVAEARRTHVGRAVAEKERRRPGGRARVAAVLKSTVLSGQRV